MGIQNPYGILSDSPKEACFQARERDSSSLEVVNKTSMTVQEKLAKKNGAMWECVKSEEGLYGGKVFTFKLMPRYYTSTVGGLQSSQLAKMKRAAIFPAAEPMADELHNMQRNWGARSALGAFGYGIKTDSTGVYMTIPSGKAILNCLQEIRKQELASSGISELSELEILRSDGIAKDMDYVKAYFTHDILISKEREFFHDGVSHGYAVLDLALTLKKEGYLQLKEEAKKVILPKYEKLLNARRVLEHFESNSSENFPQISSETKDLLEKNLEKLEFALGAMVDVLTTYNQAREFRNFLVHNNSMSSTVKLFWALPNYEFYRWRRFPDVLNQERGFVIEELLKTWKCVEELPLCMQQSA